MQQPAQIQKELEEVRANKQRLAAQAASSAAAGRAAAASHQTA